MLGAGHLVGPREKKAQKPLSHLRWLEKDRKKNDNHPGDSESQKISSNGRADTQKILYLVFRLLFQMKLLFRH